MPLPFILGGLAVAVTAHSAKNAYDSHQNLNDANDILSQASNIYNEATKELRLIQDKFSVSLNEFEALQLRIGREIKEFDKLAREYIEKLEQTSHSRIEFVMPTLPTIKVEQGVGDVVNLMQKTIFSLKPTILALKAYSEEAKHKANSNLDEAKLYQSKVALIQERLLSNIAYIDDVKSEVVKLHRQFGEYFDDLKVVEMLLRRGNTSQLQGQDGILRMIENGVALSAILAEIFATPLFKLRTNENGEANSSALLQTDELGLNIPNEQQMSAVLKTAEQKARDLTH